MTTPRTRNAELTERMILSTIKRATVLTENSIQPHEREPTWRLLKSLVRSGRISQWRHSSGLRYWTVPWNRPLSNQALASAMALTSFCAPESGRKQLLPDEIERYFPEFFRHGLPRGYYVDAGGELPLLGFVRVDVNCSTLNRLVGRASMIIHTGRQNSAVRQLIDNDRFELTWIVWTERKQGRLQQRLTSFLNGDVRLKVVAIPELRDILLPIPASHE